MSKSKNFVFFLGINVLAVVFAAVSFTIYAIVAFGESTERVWPPHVPNEADVIEGLKGDTYVLIRRFAEDPPGLFRGCVYDDTATRLQYRGVFSLARGGPYMPGHDLLTGWDGAALYFARPDHETGEEGILEAVTAFTPAWDNFTPRECDPATIPTGR
ncbi:hypothetical protein [uncultured Rhodospira sp.]|uniref:hypothetical protein n=1 Tax=uncultured Rhodospira sp. TaxID=1936189 RepID=UPI002609156F|nr:hypothetical protein [uncultured Rhodospira sp.]